MNSYPRNNSQTIQVKFTRYGNEAEVPLEYLKPRSAASAGAAGQRPPKRPAPEGSSQVGDGAGGSDAGTKAGSVPLA